MHLEKITLTHFKNYEAQTLDLVRGVNCFTGMNGMGKTNLLDAIYYLCISKSYFGLADRELVLEGQDFFRLEGRFVREGRGEKIVAKVMPRKQKVFECNDVPYTTLSAHIGLFPVVIIAPDDTGIALGGSEERRRFVDNALSQIDPLYLQHLMTYNKVLKQRNALLKQFADRERFEPALLAIYDEQMIAPAGYLYEVRRAFMAEFSEILADTYTKISGGQEIVSCQYQSKLADCSLSELLRSSLAKDRALQRSTAGPHRDDLDFAIAERPLKRFASQGQLKSFILALKLAQYQMLKHKKNKPPILLLDDIFDKLDAQRVKHLLALIIQEDYGQVFITDTHQDRTSAIVANSGSAYRNFHIEQGKATVL